jgi:single stranded DNA-binding protein
MYGLNDVTLVGTLTRAPKLAYTPNGTAVLRFTLTGEERIINSSGEVKTLTFYHAVKVLGSRAEDLADLQAGAALIVAGKLDFSSWEDAEGDKHSRLEVLGLRMTETVVKARVSSGVNMVRVGGNLTRDAESKTTNSGISVLNLSIAVNESFKKGKQFFEKTHYVDITVWGALAQAYSDIKKGSGVFITGRLVNDSWTDHAGKKHSSLKVEASNLEEIFRKPRVEPKFALKPARQAVSTSA